MLSFWVLVCIGVVGLPHSALRCFGYRDSKALHRGILIGTIVSALLMFGMHLAGALGRAILPGMDSPDKIMPSLMMEVLPLAGRGLPGGAHGGHHVYHRLPADPGLRHPGEGSLPQLPESGEGRPGEAGGTGAAPLLLCTLILGTLVLLAALQPPR